MNLKEKLPIYQTTRTLKIAMVAQLSFKIKGLHTKKVGMPNCFKKFENPSWEATVDTHELK